MANLKETKTYTTVVGMVVPTQGNPRLLTNRKGEPYAQVTVKDTKRDMLVGIKIWAENLALIPQGYMDPGAIIYAEGEYQRTEKEGKTYHNVNASTLNILPPLGYGQKPDSQVSAEQPADDFFAAASNLEF